MERETDHTTACNTELMSGAVPPFSYAFMTLTGTTPSRVNNSELKNLKI
jgi:hypothetical protein